MKGVEFPGAETLPNADAGSKHIQDIADHLGFEEPESIEEENFLLRRALEESLVPSKAKDKGSIKAVSTTTRPTCIVIDESVGSNIRATQMKSSKMKPSVDLIYYLRQQIH